MSIKQKLRYEIQNCNNQIQAILITIQKRSRAQNSIKIFYRDVNFNIKIILLSLMT